MVALINDPREAETCQEMIASVRKAREAIEHMLISTVLDRETYLLKMGAADALRSQQEELHALFRRRYPS